MLRDVASNRDVARVQLAYVLFNGTEWGTWIAMLVYAYAHGGATASGLVAVAQLVPATLLAPLLGSLGDRHPPARALLAGYVLQAATMGGTAAALAGGAPPLVVYALAASGATAVTATRPAQAALLPGLARTPEELTAANVLGGWSESVSLLVAPALTGVLLRVSGPALAYAVLAGAVALAAVLVRPLRGPAAAGGSGAGALAETRDALRLLRREPAARSLVLLVGAETTALGALDVIYVVLAVSVLGLGGSGAGFLNAAFGAGGVLAAGATVALVGRLRLALPLLAGAGAMSLALAALGLHASVALAFALLAVAGGGRSVLDVAARTLLQRTAPADVLARVFGVLESLVMAGYGVGSLLAPALVAVAGARGALLGTAAVVPLALVLLGPRLRRADASATVPVVEIALLRSRPLFAPLRPPELEALARSLEPVIAPAGTTVVREGDRGDRFYVVADGTLEVTQGGTALRTLGRGDCFGEIALLRDVPRTATVTATSAVRLQSLAKATFLAVVTGHPQSGRAADSLVQERLAAATIAP